MDSPVHVADPVSYEILYHNEAFATAWGEVVAGRRCHEAIFELAERCPFCTNGHLFGEDAPGSYVWERRDERTDRWFRCYDRAIRWGDGRMVRFQLAMDVTRNKQTEIVLARRTLELEKINEELRASNAELDEFTYIASHDLQAPLRTIVNYGGFLSEDVGDDLPTQAKEDLGRIVRAGEAMQHLIDDLLMLSRAGRFDLHFDPLPLGACVDAALESLDETIRECDAVVTRDELPVVVGDQRLLTQLLQNLISNALKFVPEGRTPEVHVSAEESETGWVFGVRDNGIGIEAQYVEKVFQAFKRLHGVGAYTGTGIGLAICRRAVERHAGRIWVVSTPDAGAHFRFTLGTDQEDIENPARLGRKPVRRGDAAK